MTDTQNTPIVLPALRGTMGDRTFYSCLMNFDDIAARVSYAREIHQNQSLSDMIQRELETRRGKEIAQYIEEQPERFFNSLVVATYGGAPNWYPLSSVRNKHTDKNLEFLTEQTTESVGFLTLDGSEKLFTVDGQHRLAGIREVIKRGNSGDYHDEVSVVFVAHQQTPEGLSRTRRLFTTLNKTARPVSKGGIIALDEDDVMAICVRRLVEGTQLFDGNRVAFVAGNNLPVTNTTSLTTISNLYGVLETLFSSAATELKRSKQDLKRIRPPDKELERYFQLAIGFFSEMKSNFSELQEFFAAEDTTPVVQKYRGANRDSALFRPVGLDIFTQIVAKLTAQHRISVSEAVKLSAKLPRILSDVPYEGLMWDASTKRVTNANRVTLREILLYMLGATTKMSKSDLLVRYRRDTGNATRELPSRVI